MSLVVYVLIGLMPGDPIDMMISGDPKMTSEDAARLRALYGLDKPLLERYLAWAVQALQGNFGYSRSFSQPVLAVLWPRLLNTLLLAGSAFALSHGDRRFRSESGPPPGPRRGDYLINLAVLCGISAPPLLAGAPAHYASSPSCWLLPAGGMADVRPARLAPRTDRAAPPSRRCPSPRSPWSQLGHLHALHARRDDRGAAPGLCPYRAGQGRFGTRVPVGPCLRQCARAVLTVLALSFGGLFSGRLITETMFAWPGMGKAIYQAILDNDYNLALVGLLIATLATMLGNLLADLAYAWVDPRVSIGGRA
jgi:peptide/nickel transport system permease protein